MRLSGLKLVAAAMSARGPAGMGATLASAPRLQFCPLDKTRVPELVDLIVSQYFTRLPFFQATAHLPGGAPELQRGWVQQMLQQELSEDVYPLSVIAVDADTDRMVGATFNTPIPGVDPWELLRKQQHDMSKLFTISSGDLVKDFDPLQLLQVSKCLDLTMFVVHPDYSHRGILKHLIRITQDTIMPQHGFTAAQGLLASEFSYFACMACGFQEIKRVQSAQLKEYDRRIDISFFEKHPNVYLAVWPKVITAN